MITVNEINWLKKEFPKLEINEGHTIIEGVIDFTSVYDPISKKFTALLKPGLVYPGLVLSGSYKVKMTSSKKDRSYPELQVFVPEDKWKMDRHFYPNTEGKACLSGPVEEDDLFARGYCFFEYFERFVIPFLYGQTYYDSKKQWPWKDYAHGAVGVLQSFYSCGDSYEHVQACLRRLRSEPTWMRLKPILAGGVRIDGKTTCFCGSGEKMVKCHGTIWYAIVKFQKSVRETGISLD